MRRATAACLASRLLGADGMAEAIDFFQHAGCCVPWLRVVAAGCTHTLHSKPPKPNAVQQAYDSLHCQCISLDIAASHESQEPFGNLPGQIKLDPPKYSHMDDFRPLSAIHQSCLGSGQLSRRAGLESCERFAQYLLLQSVMYALAIHQTPQPSSHTLFIAIDSPGTRVTEDFNVDDFYYSLPGQFGHVFAC